jgi:hypothetical protein
MAIKGGHPLRLIRISAVSTSGKPSPPHCLCTQIPELQQSPELLPNPKDRHLHRHLALVPSTTLVSFACPSSALLTSIQCLGPCQAGVLRSMYASRGHLTVGCPFIGHHWQRHVDLDVVCPWPPLRATPCQVVPHRSGCQLCAAWLLGSRW